ncbi:MAG: hypothetical protein KJZ83_00100 [Burkholderiaceae bacterium]|nr:hypothetical protein [Burkholderiaceae bacterium]
MATWDLRANFLPADASEYEKANREGLEECGSAVGLTSAMLVHAVDLYYTTQPQKWERPAFVVLLDVLNTICQKQINAVRATRGLTPLNMKP